MTDALTKPRTLRLVALFELGEGALVLLAGFALLGIVHRDLESLGNALVEHLHLNPASRYPHIFLDVAANVTDVQLWMLAGGAAVYASLRIAEVGYLGGGSSNARV